MKIKVYIILQVKVMQKKIIESGYIKPAGIITSYGMKSCFMFNGIPDLPNYIKNLGLITDLLTGKTNVVHAIKTMISSEDIQNHYQIRPLNDGAIMFHGKCYLEDEKTKHVELVLDGKKNKDGKTELFFRERTEEEIKSNPEGITSEALRKLYDDYRKENDITKIKKLNNMFGVLKGVKFEAGYIASGVRSMWNRRKLKQIEDSPKQKFDKLIDNGVLAKNTPVHDSEYVSNKLELKKKGLKSVYVKEAVEKIKSDVSPKILRGLNSNFNVNQKYAATLGVAIAVNTGLESLQDNENLKLLIDAMNGNPHNNSKVDVLLKSKDENDFINNSKDSSIPVDLYRVYADAKNLSEMTRKGHKEPFKPSSLRLDASKQLIDTAFQLRELYEYIPDLANILRPEEKTRTQDDFIKELKDEFDKQPKRKRNIDKAKINMRQKSDKDKTKDNKEEER